MEVVHPRVAGIDVHKRVVWVAVRRPGERTVAVRRFRTFWRPLRQMAAWLAELGVTDAAMESTGVYWWPVYHALAQAGIGVCVCNAAHMRNVPGRKTDLADCQWIAELHEYGLLRPSFIPAGAVANMRARNRYRKKLIQQRVSEGQRLSKVLEDAGIKIDSVASDMLGKSGRAMIEALIAGNATRNGSPAWPWAGCAARPRTCRWPATAGRRPRPDVTPAPGRLRPPHRPDRRAGHPGRRGGRAVRRADRPAGHHPRHRAAHRRGDRAETGGDMARFATAARLAAWAGLAPGDNESAGKRKHAAARQGDRHLRAAMVQAAWTTARTRTRPGARSLRLARRFGKGHEKGGAVAVAHTLICITWAVLSRGQDYAEARPGLLRAAGPPRPRAPHPSPPASPGPPRLPGHPHPARRRHPAPEQRP